MSDPIFDATVRGYRFVAKNAEHGDALVTISRDGKTIREFKFPAYKVWNIAAHAEDIAEGLESESDAGLYLAGSDGLGGNAYSAGGGQ